MKTSVNMIRKMGDFKLNQRTKDGMFNATSLLRQWNSVPGNPKRDLSKFWESSKINEFLQALVDEGILHTPKQGYVKSKASRGANAGTWMNPYLFIKFAMWINPRFEVKVIRFVYDQLIEYRNNAGDNYIGLTNAVSRLKGRNYSQIAKGLNYIIFGKHEPGLRQNATEDQLIKLTDLQKKLAFAVDMGYINTYSDLILQMRKLYHQKWDNK